jgi:hypothetical protein
VETQEFANGRRDLTCFSADRDTSNQSRRHPPSAVEPKPDRVSSEARLFGQAIFVDAAHARIRGPRINHPTRAHPHRACSSRHTCDVRRDVHVVAKITTTRSSVGDARCCAITRAVSARGHSGDGRAAMGWQWLNCTLKSLGSRRRPPPVTWHLTSRSGPLRSRDIEASPVKSVQRRHVEPDLIPPI